MKLIKKGKPSDIKIGILMPIPYSAAVNSLFFQTAYEYINDLENVIAYRYVYNIKDDVLEALDTEININNLDAILISMSFELDYIYVARILDKINLLHRYKGFKKPILVAGGIAVTANPLPLVDIVDVVVIGEVDGILRDMIYVVGDDKPLKYLETFNCVSISPFKDKAKRCFVKDLNRALHAVKQFFPLDEEPVYGYGIRVEVSRGCPYLCAFCMEGHIQYPFRYRDMEMVWKIIEKGLESYISKRVVFYSLAFFSIPYMDRFLDKLIEYSIEASIPSLRIDQITKERLDVIKKLGQKTITLAPETLLKGISCSIGKCYETDHLVNIIEEAFHQGFEHVKLYLITGFPKSNLMEELEEFKKLLVKLSWIKKPKFLRIALNPLIPKPWTPYQFIPPSTILSLSHNINSYHKLAKESIFTSIESFNCKWAFAQAVIAQGSERISKLIIEWSRYGIGLKGFYKALKSIDSETIDFIYNGWKDPPWYKTIDIGLPQNYFKMRYNYLSS